MASLLGSARSRARRSLDWMRNCADVSPNLLHEFRNARRSTEYQAVFAVTEPLVTVCVTTYNRAQLLSERCLPSILRQTYATLEVVVVGDGCTDDTEERVRAMEDERIVFENLDKRGDYPIDPGLRWMVAGTAAVNHALQIASGHFLTHLDDDDRFDGTRIEKLVDLALRERADVIYHPFFVQAMDGSWRVNEAKHLAFTSVTTSSVLYHRWLSAIPWDPDAYRYKEPGDWNRFRKFRRLGVKAVRHPEPLLWHYREKGQHEAIG